MKSIVSSNDLGRLIQDKNRAKYAQFLIEQIGHPPSEKKALEVAQDLGVRIQIEGPNGFFFHSDGDLKYESLKKNAAPCPYSKKISVGKLGKEIFAISEDGGYRYIFSFKVDAFSEGRVELIPLLLALILVMLMGCYLWVRWLFKPLQWLMQGVNEVSQGNLKWNVPIRHQDEVGQLTAAFNRMREQIQETIQAKQQLLYDVSHELRSPITRIQLALELDTPSARAKLKGNLRELQSMVDRLLKSASLENRNDSLILEEINLQSLLEETIAIYQFESPKIYLNPFHLEFTIRADRALLTTLIRNLVENAVKYSSHQERPIEVSVHTQTAKEILISIQDHGCGIPEQDLDRVFEAFYRVDRSRVRSTGGYGLGLNLCRRIVQAHGGAIKIKSELDRGTLVQLRLPI